MDDGRAQARIQEMADELVACGARPGSAFGMVGMNGSAAYADVDSGVAVAVMCNRFTGKWREYS
jgi:hypothetical protein